MGTGKVRAIFVAASLLLVGGRADAKTKGKLDANELSMEVVGGYLTIVEGSIGDRHGLKFLLDTGATTSAIDRKLAERLGLATRLSEIVNFDKTVGVQWCVLPELVYGPERAANIKVVVEDLRYLQISGVRVDGVIGWDLLRKQSFRLDFAQKRVVFGANQPSGGSTVPMLVNALCLTVPVELDGRQLWMIADTGMRGTTFYEGPLEEMHESYQVQAQATGRTVAGAIDSQIAVVPRLRLGNQDLDRQVHMVRSPGSDALHGIAGYLGLAALEAKEITFDFERAELSWRK